MSQTADIPTDTHSPGSAASVPHAARSPARSSLKSLALRGTAWTVVGFGTSMVLRLAGNIILTRLLFPEAFGMMALVSVFLTGLELFSDIGIGPSIIQHQRGGEPEFVNTAWTVQVLRGLALTICAMLLSWPVGNLWFQKPALVPLMMAAGSNSLIMGFNSTKLFTANRELAMGRLMALEVFTQALGLAAMVVLALVYRSVWALLLGTYVSSAAKMVLSHVALPGPMNHFHWNRAVFQDMVRFGRWIFLTTMMTFIASQGDRLLLGRLIDAALLGVYNIAFMLSDTVTRLLAAIGQRILFPTFSAVFRSDPGKLASIYERVRSRVEGAVLPLAGLLMGAGSLIVNLLYDNRYAAAGPMVQILSVRVAIGCSMVVSAFALQAMGRPQYYAVGSALKTAWLLVGIPMGWRAFGMVGVVWVVGFSDLALAPGIWMGLYRSDLLKPRLEAKALLLTLGGFVLGLLVKHLVCRY
jgi:O-antigen/teichoic acid export membrane protein